MSCPSRFSDTEYKNWMKCSLSLIVLKESLHLYIDDEVQRFHNKIKKEVAKYMSVAGTTGIHSCGSCTWQNIKYDRTKKHWYINCNNKFCNFWLQEVLRFHTSPASSTINWRNCDISQWPSDPYQVAKAFMPKGQDRINHFPNDLDAPAILSLLYYCSFLSKSMTNSQLAYDGQLELDGDLFPNEKNGKIQWKPQYMKVAQRYANILSIVHVANANNFILYLSLSQKHILSIERLLKQLWVTFEQFTFELINARNTMFHSGNLSVSDTDKDTWINDMLQLLLDLNVQGVVYTEIEKIKVEDLDVNFRETEKKVIQDLVSSLKNDCKMMETAVCSLQNSTSCDLNTVNATVSSLIDSQTHQEEEMKILQDGSCEVAGKVVALETEMKEMKNSVQQFTQDFSMVKSFLDINSDIVDQNLMTKVGNIEKDFINLQASVAVLKDKEENSNGELTLIKSVVEGVKRKHEDLDGELSSLRSDVDELKRRETVGGKKMKYTEATDHMLGEKEQQLLQQDGAAAMWNFTLEDIRKAWQTIERELLEDLSPKRLLRFFIQEGILSADECKAIRQKKRRQMAEKLLQRVKEKLPDAFFVLLKALKETDEDEIVHMLIQIIDGTYVSEITAPVSDMPCFSLTVGVKKDGNTILTTEKTITGTFGKVSDVLSFDLYSVILDLKCGSVIIHLQPLSKHARETLELFCRHGGMNNFVLNLLKKKDIFASLPAGEVCIDVQVCCHDEDHSVPKGASEPQRDLVPESYKVVYDHQVIKGNLLLQYGSLLEESEPLHLQKTFIDRNILGKSFFERLKKLRRRERARLFLNEVLDIGSEEALLSLVDALKDSGNEDLATKLCCVETKTLLLQDTDLVDDSLVEVVHVKDASKTYAEEDVLWSCRLEVMIGKNDDVKEEDMALSIEEAGASQNTLRKKNEKSSLFSMLHHPCEETKPQGKLFGHNLGDITTAENPIPKPIMDLMTVLFSKGPYTVGILQESPNERLLKELHEKMDNGEECLNETCDPLVVGELLKEFLRCIPQSLMYEDLFDDWIEAHSLLEGQVKLNKMKQILEKLPPCHFALLQHLLCLLFYIDKRSDKNKMTAYNLSMCIAPSLLWAKGNSDPQATPADLLKFMIHNFTYIFGEESLHLFGDPIEQKTWQESSIDSVSMHSVFRTNTNEDLYSGIEEYSFMEQPPLIKQLKTILAEYPDNGQIIKELLQNAEDAGASEVKILYDDRCINPPEDNKSEYQKFLRGPALCIFNDATFKDLDWKGIKMIYGSVKEEDPLKVGRFGLGFKSVFHITDHPVVLSGDRILFMDPYTDANHVCLTIQLSKLQKWKKLNIDDFFVALDGTFGVSMEILETGRYNGTLFWFPLRSKASELSDTVYNREMVMDLFTSFKTEASSILVFLKHLTKVSLHERKRHKNMISLQFTVEIVNNVEEVREFREAFLTKIRNLNKSIPHNSIDCRYHLSFCTQLFDGDNVVKKINNDWKVINYYKGGSMSEELRTLIQDNSLGYHPLVGVAAPMGQTSAEFKGHVYCFLPLPQKTKSMTGLPVHVNGFFALSQNRHHIKWPSAEQEAMHLYRDKSLVWNEKLLKEVLPDAYEILISEMIIHAVKNGNPDDIVQCVYETIPRVDKVVDEWNAILPSLFGRNILGPTLMTVNMSGEKSWISCSEAFFATFCQYTNFPHTAKSTIVKVLQMYNKRYVDVPLHVFKSFSKFNSHLTDMCPKSFAAVLKEDPRYKSLSGEEKLIVLEFLTLDCCYEIMEGLELLPLQDGSFIRFVSRHLTSEEVLLCNKEEIEFFPGLEKKFVYQAHQNQWLQKHMTAMIKQGLYQIQFMEAATFRALLEKVLQEHLGPASQPTVRPFSILTGNWIKKVWKYIFSHKYDVAHFQDMPLIPLLKSGSWSDIQEMELYQLTNFMIVKQIQNVPSLHMGIYRCLELLSIRVLPSLPEWLQMPQILKYIHYSTLSEVIQLLDYLYLSTQREKLISSFNKSCEEGVKKEFVCFLVGCSSWTSNSKSFVRCLKLFTENGSVSRSVSVQENTTVTRVADFPVKFPRPLITGSYDECQLAFALGATELDRKSFIMETLQMMQGTTYSFSEKQTFMQYFMQNISEFEHDKNILDMASTVSFLESNIMHTICTPTDLFDPLDFRLQELFYGENRFPAKDCFQTKTVIEALKKIGLKTYSDLSAIELYDVAQLIESWCKNEKEGHEIPVKANCFLKVLMEKPHLLNVYVHGNTLKIKLMDMKCILHAKEKDIRFPSVLPWFQREHELSKPSELRLLEVSTLVGSTMPLINCKSKELAEAFGWNQDPPQDKVVEQLRLLINVYESRYKPELLQIIKEIYQELNKYRICDLLVDPNFQILLQNGCVWRGDGFSSPQEIFLDSKGNDLELSPYLYKLPEEFNKLDSFFLGLGCNKEQNLDVFLKIQIKIKDKHETGIHCDDNRKRDLSILISILNRLRQERSKIQDRLNVILFPIHCSDESRLVLKPGPQCTYCDAQWLRGMTSEETDEENIYYVHEDVLNMTAEELGVKSLTQHLLSDTEELVVEEWGQKEPLTTRLHRLLKEGFQDGFSFSKEIIQNADDAGANHVYFLYDERENEDAKINLLDVGMAECQGPAFWAYNDAHFQTEDFKNITRLNAATKKDELEKIGKFGLGFCSVYNLTDVPSFISGSNVVIFDPHKSHLGKALPGSSPGMKIDFRKMKNLRMMNRLKTQFKPFQNIFGCNISCDFNGTLFRFPLRTASQAQKSEICDKYYSKKESLELLHMTIEAAGNLLLFTQHIQEIKIFHLPADCNDPKQAKVIFSMSKEDCRGQPQGLNEENILSQVSKLYSAGELRSSPLKRLQKITIKEKLEQYAVSILPSLTKEAGVSVKASWLISWATGTNEALSETFRDVVGALPLCAVAVPFEMQDNLFCPIQLKDLPFGFYKSSHLFCFLPLPIFCGLPVHINGCFALTSDRRQLMTSTEDDKKAQFTMWNTALIQDALVNAYVYLLEGIRENSPPQEYEYFSLWPLECQKTEIPITRHFLEKLLQLESRLFHRDLHWQSFDKCLFLDPALRNDGSIGETAFETFLTFHSGSNYVIMELPDHVMDSLKTYYPDELRNRIVSKEKFFLSVFLPNIDKEFWSQSQVNIQKRDKLVIYALGLEDKAVKASLSNTRCIPSEPSGALKCPAELVNPLCDLSDMFSADDEVFPHGTDTFRHKKIIEILVVLGMIENYLPFNFLEDRCQSVVKLAQTCGQCAIKRCAKILKYLSEHNIQEKLDKNQGELQKLRHMHFLPVLQKPPGWNFSWKGNTQEHTIQKTCEIYHASKTITLDSAANLFQLCTQRLLGCVELVLDEISITNAEPSIRFFYVSKLLRLKGSKKNDVPYKTVVRQLKTIAQEYKNMPAKDTNNHCKAIMVEIYSFLDRLCKKSEEIRSACLKDLSKEEVILLGDQMLDASRVAFNLSYKCSPVLFSLENTELAKHKNFLKAIGIKENFDVHKIVTVLRDKKKQWKRNPLSAEDIDLINGLLSALKDSMMEKGIQYDILDESLQRDIVAPDVDKVLRETSSLCLDDSEFEIGPDTKPIHAAISPQLALALGVKTKRRKCFDELSCLILGGQKEKLVTRLKGILSAYPCDDGIMKELLQNADDAQASEIHFIKDYRTHGYEKIFDDKYAPLQGPALCVFNNSIFTRADVEGIHDLGLGSKQGDPLKTGQYGVGFNAVYHLTDAPSFLTMSPELEHGEMLCIFDPTCQYLPKVTEQNPGVRCIVSHIRKNYPDVLTGYLERDLLQSKVGTVFRFPLRNKIATSVEDLSSEQVGREELNVILNKFCVESFDALLFLKHVSKITLSDISSGELKEEYRVETVISEEDKERRDTFFQYVKIVSTQYKQDRRTILSLPSSEVGYRMTVLDSMGRSKLFYIVQRIGFMEGYRTPQTIVHALDSNNIGQLPMGGVAIVIPDREELMKEPKKQNDTSKTSDNKPAAENGRAFCFLPLPLRTGLPCHINGHFALDHEARRSLWKDDKGFRHDWNHYLFENIVSPAYVSALQFLKHILFDCECKNSFYIIQRLLKGFLSYFPLMSVANDDDWKAIVKYVYLVLDSKEVPVFPMLHQREVFDSKNTLLIEPELKWTALKMTGHTFPAYFHRQDRHLCHILKSLGMKVIDIPGKVKKSMEESGVRTDMVSPVTVLKFLKSHSTSDAGICNLKVNLPVLETTFRNIDNVRCIIEYIAYVDNLENEIDNMPLLVTNDGVLRPFSTKRCIIHSIFSDLLPSSSENFVHSELYSVFHSEKMKKSGVFFNLGMQNFMELLPLTLPPDIFRVGEDVLCLKSSNQIPNKSWIVRLWHFIHNMSLKKASSETKNPDLEAPKTMAGISNLLSLYQHTPTTVDEDALEKNVKLLSQWSLLPVRQNDTNTLLLMPLTKMFTVIDIALLDHTSDLGIVLRKMNLPSLDTSIFSGSEYTFLWAMIRTLVASTAKPRELLTSLCYHKEKIRSTLLTNKQCSSVLEYFARRVTDLKHVAEDRWISESIKALPLHITQQGTRTSLDGNEEVLILPTRMPTVGIDEWASNTGHILLGGNLELDELYKLLGCATSSIIDVYCTKILPSIQALPIEHHIKHLVYIKEKLLNTSYFNQTVNEEQHKLINVLKSTAFISTDYGMKCASEFYDPFHNVFAQMCDKSDFPPAPFDDSYWNDFLKRIGLKKEVREKKFVEFAEKLAREGASLVTKDVMQKSDILIQHLLHLGTSTWGKETLERLSKAKFIPPYCVSEELLLLCKQYSVSTSLICFSESIPCQYQRLCWTSMHMLPEWACHESEELRKLLSTLGVYLKPPIERVILHCQNICDAQKLAFLGKKQYHSDVYLLQSVLDSVYDFLSKHKDEDQKIKEKLHHTPLVFIPESFILLPARNIVIDLTEEDAVEPYLYRAPSYYGRYNDFFMFLGAAKQVTCNHYFLVLETIYQQQKEPNEKLLPHEQRIVRKAIMNLVKLLTNVPGKDKDLNIRTLYLPNRKLVLKNARELIISDRKSIESRLTECNLDFFIGFIELDLKVSDPRPVIKALPDICRPKLLSEIVKEDVDRSEMSLLESQHAICVENFLHSTEFVHGILRLVKHEKNEVHKSFTKEDEDKVFDHIQNIKVREVSGLYTYLVLFGERIQSSKTKEKCFIQYETIENKDHYIMYFQVNNRRELTLNQIFSAVELDIIDMITEFIKRTTGTIVTKMRALFEMLKCFGVQGSIEETLDKCRIDPYDSPQKLSCTIFPSPGTYVPKEFHAFLEQGFSMFQRHEYDSLAYELEDDNEDTDSGEPVYIYVRIISPVESTEHSEMRMKAQYEIDIGDPERCFIKVYTYKLFKFERKLISESQDLLLYDSIPVGSLPFDDNCRRIQEILKEAWTLPREERRRILKRILLRFHPDKNTGQEDYCNRTFSCIYDIVSKLDSGQLFDTENINFTTCEGKGVFTGTEYENLGRRVNTRSSQYRKQHDQHENAYYEAHRGRSSGAAFPVPDQPNALRWIRQAKKDLSSAKTFLSPAGEVPAFNWICYHCHQATEKAIKAAVYATDANKVDLKSCQLANIASRGGLSDDLVRLAMDLEECLGEHTTMRYPDSISRTQIPAELFTSTHARTALELTERVIHLAEENYLN